MNTSEKLDLIIFKIDKIDERLDKLEKRVDILETRVDKLEERMDKMEEQNRIEHKKLHDRITRFEATNLEQHEKIMELLASINATLIRLETENTDKISALFDAREDFLNHKKTYGHELVNLRKIAKQNSFKISNLERKQKCI